MVSPLDAYRTWATNIIGYYGRTNDFNGFRVNYTTSSEVSLFTASSLRLDTKSAKGTVMNPLPGVVYMVIAGKKDILLPGDRLEATPADGSTPVVTVVHNTSMSDCIAIRTGRIGTIENTQRSALSLYTNVYFDFVSVSGPAAPQLAEFSESIRLETNRAVLYTRAGIKKGQRLIDSATGTRYLILAVSGTGNHLLLQLQGDPK